jgi:hypothetical protein
MNPRYGRLLGATVLVLAMSAVGAGLATAETVPTPTAPAPTVPTYPTTSTGPAPAPTAPTPTTPAEPPPSLVTFTPDPANHTRPDATIQVKAQRTYQLGQQHYFFQVQKLECINGATRINFTVLKLHRSISCTTRLAMISGYLSMGTLVKVTAQPVRTTHSGHILRRGPSKWQRMQLPNY